MTQDTPREGVTYLIRLENGRDYRGEWRGGQWYLTDGTGWSQALAEGEKPTIWTPATFVGPATRR